MLRHFNAQAQQAVSDARVVAHRLAHHYVGTEHLLVGLAGTGASSAAWALTQLGLDAEALENRLVETFGRGQPAGSPQPESPLRAPLTSSATLALQRCRWEARQHGHHQVATADVLRAVIHLADSTAATLLDGFGVDAEQIEGALARCPFDGVDAEARAVPDDRERSVGPPGVLRQQQAAPAEDSTAAQLLRMSVQLACLQAEVGRLTELVDGMGTPSAHQPCEPGETSLGPRPAQ